MRKLLTQGGFYNTDDVESFHFSTPPDGQEHAYWFDLCSATMLKGPARGKKSWTGRIMNFTVRQPFADRELTVKNLRFLKERPSLPPDPVITSALPSEAVPRAGRPFVLEAVDEWGEGSLGYPNHAQGFGILESVREAFGRKPAEGWPVNYAPEDVGLTCPQRAN